MSGLDIDTRTDIYSLGVLSMNCWRAATPFDPKELLASGLDRCAKPSAKGAGAAEHTIWRPCTGRN